MRRLGIITALLTLLMAVSASVALGAITRTIDPANAPVGTHFQTGDATCVVNSDLSVSCSTYELGGVGNANATADLSASYTAIIDCNNKGNNKNNPVESHTAAFEAANSTGALEPKNGRLRVPALSVSPFSAPQVCPNPNWTPVIRAGTLQLVSFTYTLTFEGFTGAYITITGP
jgi:hypothetical protein